MTVMDCCEATSCGNLAAWRFTAPGVELDLCDRHAEAMMDTAQRRTEVEGRLTVVVGPEWAVNAHEAA